MPDENGHTDPLEAADHAMLEHNPKLYDQTDGRVFKKAFGPFPHEPVKVDLEGLEKRLLAGIGKLPDPAVPRLTTVKMNSDEYRRLKAAIFVMSYAVGTSKTPECTNMLSGIRVIVDDSLTEVLYFDQHGHPMTPPPPTPPTEREQR